MRMYDVIQKKRDGNELTDEEIRFFIQGYTDGSIPDYQASAMTMAIFLRGMTDREIVTLTEAMAHSGDMVDLSRFGNLTADKHSTGGVGDKTSMIVAPVVASLGGKMSKMTGRGLGHTGGTADKLESIPGYRIALTSEEFTDQVDRIGLAVVGQSGNLTPADKKLYALRDVTATVDSIPLITSSIMSKKLAAGSHNITLDVKFGSGSFMKTADDAEVLARKMVRIGTMSGRNTAAVLTNMDVPLGSWIGNAVEVKEAIAVLRGEEKNDLYEVCMTLSSTLISLIFGIEPEEARAKCEDAIDSGKAYRKMQEWISAQGGDVRYIKDPSLFPVASCEHTVCAESTGYIVHMDTAGIGTSAVILGAGRASKEDDIDHAAGIQVLKKTGDAVTKGEPIAVLYSNMPAAMADAERRYHDSISISSEAPAPEPLVYKTIRAKDL